MTYQGMIAETVTIRGNNGDEIEAYYSRPLGAGPYPSVVVIHHIFGLDEWNREVTRKLAYHGYAALAPNLYSRLGPGSPEDQGRGRGAVAASVTTRWPATSRAPCTSSSLSPTPAAKSA